MFVRRSAYFSVQSYLARRSVQGLQHIRWLGTAKINNPAQASAVHISNVSGDDSKQSGEPINLDHCIQLFNENKFPEIVNEWENVKKFTRKLSLNEEVLSVLASSADKAGKANLVIGMFDFAKAHNLDVVDPSIYESYIIECAKNPPKYWMKAHNIVEAIASTDSKPSLPQSGKREMANCVGDYWEDEVAAFWTDTYRSKGGLVSLLPSDRVYSCESCSFIVYVFAQA
jgi:hypothetical protein